MKHYQKYSTVALVKKENFNYEISIACCNSSSINISAQCNAFIKQKIMVK